uniref:Uncharacterized protein n=1 Tax=Panagrolaimus sp. PS1159 TaxID=55785 RepID=A0AC35EY82_9BILA
MENFDVFCVQFVVQSIERITNDPECAKIENIMLKFGEQTVSIDSKPIIFEIEQKYASIKKGKICFCEKEQLGFEIVLKLQKGYASNQVSFISFEDKKNRSTLQASIPLRNAFHRTLFNINFISSRHLLKNLGRQIETESIGIQATRKLRNSHSQTPIVSKSNVKIQTSKKIQKSVRTMNAVETAEVSTQTNLTKSLNIIEERKALMKLIVLLVCKLSTRINGSRIRPIRETKPKVVEEIPSEPVDIHAAQQFSNLRKKQIEQMRERLHQMAEERKEILELTNAKIENKATAIAKPVHQKQVGTKKQPDIAAFLEPPSKPIQKPTTSTVIPSTNITTPHGHPSFEFSTEKEKVIISPDLSYPIHIQQTSNQHQHSISEQHPQTPGPSTPTNLEPQRASPFSRQESILSSIHSQNSEGELDELPSPLHSQSPIPPPPLRRKSYTLAETSQESVKSLSNFLDPSSYVPPPPPQHQRPKHVEIKEPDKETVKAIPLSKINKKDKSERSSSEKTSSEEEETSATSDSETSESSTTTSSTAESSSSTSSDSTLKKAKSEPSSSSSSTLGEGSVSTEESIQEEIPEAKDSDIQSVKSVSSISEASFAK